MKGFANLTVPYKDGYVFVTFFEQGYDTIFIHGTGFGDAYPPDPEILEFIVIDFTGQEVADHITVTPDEYYSIRQEILKCVSS